MRSLPPEVQTLYAELVERLAAFEAARAIGDVPGSFVTKSVKAQTYYYFQHTAPGGRLHQIYVGRRTRVLDAVVRRVARRWPDFYEHRLAWRLPAWYLEFELEAVK